jgi:hypothetical protein
MDPSRVSELLHAYLAAEYRWQYDGSWHDVIIGLPTPGLELAYPEATSFGMLSAWNPRSVERSDDDNRRDDDALHAQLVAGGYGLRPAFASARNRSWREPSWLVMGMDVGPFDALARRFGQLGTLWWRPGEAVRLRMDAPRPPDETGDDNVDWLQ